jgi:hypothetical protein
VGTKRVHQGAPRYARLALFSSGKHAREHADDPVSDVCDLHFVAMKLTGGVLKRTTSLSP